MALFGKKKRSLEEIKQDIEALSEEEKSELMVSMQVVSEETEAPVNDPAPAVEEGNKETVEPEEAVTAEEPAEVVEETVEPTENPVEETMTDTVDTTEMETALDEPQPEEQQPNGDFGELLAAQNARFDSIESQLAALKETVEKVVANQDNKNFGYSPKANFDDDVQMSRSDAILQSYAPRRADQYK